jgi:hypothetical protein
MFSEYNDGCANDILSSSDSEATMVLQNKLSNGTPNAHIFLISNIPYISLVFPEHIQIHAHLHGICSKQYTMFSNSRQLKQICTSLLEISFEFSAESIVSKKLQYVVQGKHNLSQIFHFIFKFYYCLLFSPSFSFCPCFFTKKSMEILNVTRDPHYSYPGLRFLCAGVNKQINITHVICL